MLCVAIFWDGGSRRHAVWLRESPSSLMHAQHMLPLIKEAKQVSTQACTTKAPQRMYSTQSMEKLEKQVAHRFI
jgi:hypothetical protein